MNTLTSPFRRFSYSLFPLALCLWLTRALGAESVVLCPAGFGYDSADVVPEEELARYARRHSVAPVSKPAVVSRVSWGCPDGAASPGWPNQDKTTVTHLIVHHSATSNSSGDWSSVVRSIFTYHKIDNGWGDIGYNYLIDPNGIIYEGRAGGDNVIGAHFSCANGHTMGVCLLGTFTGSQPTAAARTSLAKLLAWKAAQVGLNALGMAYHPGTGLTLPVISGHRDGNSATNPNACASGTECPGAQFYVTLAEVRNDVATLMEGSPAGAGGACGVAAGKRVKVVSTAPIGLNVRNSAGTGATKIGNKPDGSLGTVQEGPTSANGYTWWKVLWDGDNLNGWSAEGDGATCWLQVVDGGGTVTSNCDITTEMKIETQNIGAVPLNVRNGAGTGFTKIGSKSDGNQGTVLEGPTGANGYVWWKIRWSDNLEGWSIEGEGGTCYLKEAPDIPPPHCDLATGQYVEVQNTAGIGLNIRNSAGTAATKIGNKADGSQGSILEGPTYAGGFHWWRIQWEGDGLIGWSAEGDGNICWLKQGVPPPEPKCGVATGKHVEVQNTAPIGLNVRNGATTGAVKIGNKADGSRGSVLEGPTVANGYVWWRIQWEGDGLSGWSAEGDGSICWLSAIVVDDFTKPTVTSLDASPKTIEPGSPVTVQFTVADTGGSHLKTVRLRRASGTSTSPDNGSWQVIEQQDAADDLQSGSFTDTPPGTGNWFYGLEVVDGAGNENNETASGGSPVKVVVSAPCSVTQQAPAAGAMVNFPAAFNWTTTGGGCPPTHLAFSGSPDGSPPVVVLTETGPFTVTAAKLLEVVASLNGPEGFFWAVVADGGQALTPWRSFRPMLDTTPPEVVIVQPTQGAAYTTAAPTVTLSGGASDDAVSVRWENSAGGSGNGTGGVEWTVPNVPLQPGQNIITIFVKDAAGNEGNAKLTVTRSDAKPGLGVQGFAGGKFNLQLNGTPGSQWRVRVTSDLKQPPAEWPVLGAFTIPASGNATVNEATTPANQQRYYYAEPVP